jgi:hypothetical protein
LSNRRKSRNQDLKLMCCPFVDEPIQRKRLEVETGAYNNGPVLPGRMASSGVAMKLD